LPEVHDGADPLVGLTIEMVVSSHDAVVVIAGELDLSNVGAAATVLDSMCEGAEGDVVLDLAGLEFVGFAAVDMLRAVHRRLSVTRRRVSIGATNDTVRRTFVITGDPCDDPTSRRPDR
jgi:anti-anti-sigma factor